jgi:hypothetical protein
MTLQRDDVRRACQDRRDRAAMSPAHVAVPAALALLAVVLSGLFAHWLGLGTPGIWATVGAASVLSSVAAHRTVGSLAAGAGIRLAQPYGEGERVCVHLPSLDRTVQAEVLRVGAANTTLVVRDAGFGFDGRSGVDSIVVVPNNVMLRGGLADSARRDTGKTITSA